MSKEVKSIRDLEPKIVWENFYGLTQCPRPSKHEEKCREFLLEWGKKHGIETEADETGNIIMRKPATPGMENRRGIIIQGHMDMVPQKNADVDHDFLKDPIRTVIDGEWVKAKGTTLGADDGIGVALAMAAVQSDDIKHGPLEVLVTYDEETGMTGADNLKPGVLKGDILLNLDSEDEGELCIGCAGGLDGRAVFEYEEKNAEAGYATYEFGVGGLHGGHSGMDIKMFYANANKILARVLISLIRECGVKVVDIAGGSLRNAIPFEGTTTVLIPESKVEEAEKKVAEIVKCIKSENKYTDPDGKYRFERIDDAKTYIEEDVALKAVRAILGCYHGVYKMSDTMPGLTETSVNLAIVRCEKKNGRNIIRIDSLMRSAVDSSKYFLAEQLRAVFELAGATFTTSGSYSGWTPRPDTPSYDIIKKVYKELFGEEMRVLATHGGLECAILGAKYPNWEMISVGPTIRNPHSPDEKVHIGSVARCWEFVKGILEAAPEK